MSTITLTEVRAAQSAFLTTQWPPMSTEWTALKDAAVTAIKQYAEQENKDVSVVLGMLS